MKNLKPTFGAMINILILAYALILTGCMQPEPEAPPENLVNVGQQETRGTLSNASTEKNIEIQYGILKGSVPVHVHCLQDKTDCTTELFTNKIIIRDITELSLKSFTFENRIFRITDSNIDESSIIKTLTPASDGSFETALPAGRIYMVLLDLGGIEYCHEPDCSPIIYENQATYHNITLIVNELPVYFDESPLEEVKACIKAEATWAGYGCPHTCSYKEGKLRGETVGCPTVSIPGCKCADNECWNGIACKRI